MKQKVREASRSCDLPSEAFNGVIDGQDVDALAVLDVRAGLDRDNVGQTDTQVVSHNTIHTDFLIGAGIIREHNADGFLAPLALQQHGVTTEQLELVHLCLRQTHDGVIVIGGIVDQQTIRAILALQNSGG